MKRNWLYGINTIDPGRPSLHASTCAHLVAAVECSSLPSRQATPKYQITDARQGEGIHPAHSSDPDSPVAYELNLLGDQVRIDKPDSSLRDEIKVTLPYCNLAQERIPILVPPEAADDGAMIEARTVRFCNRGAVAKSGGWALTGMRREVMRLVSIQNFPRTTHPTP